MNYPYCGARTPPRAATLCAGAQNNPTPRRCPTDPRDTPGPRRCAKEPDRRAGIIGIEMPKRSIEHGGLADGAAPETAPMTEKEPVTVAPLTASAWCCKSDPAMRQKPPMPAAAARCDLFFV